MTTWPHDSPHDQKGSVWLATLGFVAAWTLLDLSVNLRYPASEPAYSFLLPSIDLAVVLGAFALFGKADGRLPWPLRFLLVGLVVFVRILRLGDALVGMYFGQAFNLYTDLPLAPELVRFAHSTLPLWKFGLWLAALPVALALLTIAADRSFCYAAKFLSDSRHASRFGIVLACFALASFFTDHDPRYNDSYAGAFAKSAVPRVSTELAFLANAYNQSASEARRMAELQERWLRLPTNLAKLRSANVYLFFVESYGATVIDRDDFAARVGPVYSSMDADLAAHGFDAVSSVLASSTYGGRSWLAHATLMTGFRTTNQLEYDLLGVKAPKTIAGFFRNAGYHTVLVEPNTERVSPHGDFYEFDERVYARNFDYVGPSFGWANMPDQYVVDFVRRQVIARSSGPLFVASVLVSSHASWSTIPRMLDDWSAIQNGDIYNRTDPVRFATSWPAFASAAEPYITSIVYDLDVLRRYLVDFVSDGSLVVILGDHQPVSEVTDDSPSRGVPIHVVSRDRTLLEPFLARGYTPGMAPARTRNPAGMETFLASFLADFSSTQEPAAQGPPSRLSSTRQAGAK